MASPQQQDSQPTCPCDVNIISEESNKSETATPTCNTSAMSSGPLVTVAGASLTDSARTRHDIETTPTSKHQSLAATAARTATGNHEVKQHSGRESTGRGDKTIAQDTAASIQTDVEGKTTRPNAPSDSFTITSGTDVESHISSTKSFPLSEMSSAPKSIKSTCTSLEQELGDTSQDIAHIETKPICEQQERVGPITTNTSKAVMYSVPSTSGQQQSQVSHLTNESFASTAQQKSVDSAAATTSTCCATPTPSIVLEPTQATASPLVSDQDSRKADLQNALDSVAVCKNSENESCDSVLHGSLENLPEMKTDIVRIFISSTFADFRAERNILHQKAYPELRQYCNKNGLDFQVMDMRWGVTDTMCKEHKVSELCIQEIKTCRQLSCGPNFVCLLGNRYGSTQLPASIQKKQFETLRELVEAERTDVLDKWYREDTNAVPPVYMLQSFDMGCISPNKFKELQRQGSVYGEDKEDWGLTYRTLQYILQTSADIAYKKGLISKQDKKIYTVSVTEDEVYHGIFQTENPNEKALCFVRELQDLNLNCKEAVHFMDIKETEPDLEASELLAKLLNTKVPRKLRSDNIKKYSLTWKGKALENTDDEDYRGYLEQLSIHFVDDMKSLISRNIQKQNAVNLDDQLLKEAVHHAKFANTKTKIFCGRIDVLDRAMQYVKQRGENEQKPLVIYGKSGCGKTSVLAKIAKEIPTWTDASSVVMRFLGTSPMSSMLPLFLRSVITQIRYIMKLPILKDNELEKMEDIKTEFFSLLQNDTGFMSSLVVVIDSIDQLSSLYAAHRMAWLPKTLSKNVFLIVSVLSDPSDCWVNIQKRLQDPNMYFELQTLPREAGEEIMDTYMIHHCRTLQEDQRQKIVYAFDTCPQPLFLKLVLDRAKLWNSFSPVNNLNIAASVHSAITSLFKNIERKYGGIFVTKALGYLTCGKGGLSGIEMEDVLSCDDQVLNAVYQYHDPPLEGTIRVPSLLWARVQQDLKEYISEVHVDGKTVMVWYHRKFFEVAETLYVTTGNKKELHKALADMYAQEKGLKRTITLYQRKNKVIKDADRCISSQPLTPNNVRKLNALPYHLLHSRQFDLLKTTCLLNFKWVYTKLSALGVNTVHCEYDEIEQSQMLKDEEKRELEIFVDFLELCFDSLRNDPKLLAYELLARMKGVTLQNKQIKQLVADASDWIQSTDVPLLVPVHPVNFESLDGPLKFQTVIGFDGILTSDRNILVCNWIDHMSSTSKIQTFNMRTRCRMASVGTFKGTPFSVAPNDKCFAFVQENNITLCDIETGEVQKCIPYSDAYNKDSVIRAIVFSANQRNIAIGVKPGKPVGKIKHWVCCPQVYLIDIEEGKTVAVKELKRQKHVQHLFFVKDNTLLIAVSRDSITVMACKDLQVTHAIPVKDCIVENTVRLLSSAACLVGVCSDTNRHVAVITYNYNHSIEAERLTKVDFHSKDHPFGLYCNRDGKKIACGTCKEATKSNGVLSTWDKDMVQYIHIAIDYDRAAPSSIAVNEDWTIAIVGWVNGNISLWDIKSQKEVGYIVGHRRQVTHISLLSDFQLLTMGIDHTVKVWDMLKLESWVNNNSIQEDVGDFDQTGSNRNLQNESENILAITAQNKFIITSPAGNEMSPTFWDPKSGNILKNQSQQVEEMCRTMLTHNVAETSEKHFSGNVHLIEEKMLVCTRQTDRQATVLVFSDIHSPKAQSVQGVYIDTVHTFIFETVVMDDAASVKPYTLVAVGINSLKVYNLPNLELKQTIPLPKIEFDISSGKGKSKLSMARYAMTLDGKYFIILYTHDRQKYMQLVNLQEGRYVKKCYLPPNIKAKNLDDTLLYLIMWSDENPQLLQPRDMSNGEKSIENATYQSLLTLNANQFLTPDRSLGIEKGREYPYPLDLWQLNLKRPKKLQQLGYHDHEIKCCSWAQDNKFIATGSIDGTVRVWCLDSGELLCTFCVYGKVSAVHFTPDAAYLAVHYYKTEYRGSAMILECKNRKEQKSN